MDLNKTLTNLELDLDFGDISAISAYDIDTEITFNSFCSGLKRKRADDDNGNDDTSVYLCDDTVIWWW